MKHTRIDYPDGQISVKIDEDELMNQFIFRINSYKDLIELRSITEAINYLGYNTNEITVTVPCLFGQRSDLRFSENQSFDLKIIAEIINACNFGRVILIDPHSAVGPALINNSSVVSSLEYVKLTVEDLNEEITFVSPDAGAYKKVFKYSEELDIPLVAANKFRDKEGKVTLNFLGDVKDKTCLIVDDICDGGYTFYLLSKALKEQGAKKVFLYVTHGYFSKGFATRLEPTDENSSLIKCLDGIYCTDSVKQISNEYNDGYNIKSLNNFVKQFKIEI